MAKTIAFTARDITAILAFCDERWTAFVRIAWETGLRQSDLLALEWDQLGEDGTVRVVQMKDGVEFVSRLRPETVDSLRAIRRPGDRLVFSAESRPIASEWKSLLRRAGMNYVSLNELRSSALRRLLEE